MPKFKLVDMDKLEAEDRAKAEQAILFASTARDEDEANKAKIATNAEAAKNEQQASSESLTSASAPAQEEDSDVFGLGDTFGQSGPMMM